MLAASGHVPVCRKRGHTVAAFVRVKVQGRILRSP